MTREEWDVWTRGSAIRRAGYAGFKRNVAVAMGNWLASVDEVPEGAVAVLRDAVEGDEPLVREHAAWALERAGVSRQPFPSLRLSWSCRGAPRLQFSTVAPNAAAVGCLAVGAHLADPHHALRRRTVGGCTSSIGIPRVRQASFSPGEKVVTAAVSASTR
jgi:hypothetical protein